MIEKAINKICQARVCAECKTEMEDDYVVRDMGRMARANCERCGKLTITSAIKYTLGYNGFVKLGLFERS